VPERARIMKTLGLIGGMSWESTAIYYRLLNEGAKQRLGGLHSAPLVLWSVDFADIEARQALGDWEGLGALMVAAGRRLEAAGAEALVICTNTMHKLVPDVERAVSIPVIHIADATAAAIRATSARRPALLATRYTMEQDFYRGRLRDRHGIDAIIPDERGRAVVHRVIYQELCRGIIDPASKQAYLDEVGRLRDAGADGLILGCTEVGMILSQDDFDFPVFDTTAIHAAAALDFAIG
jgi:aspartate racemase